MMNRIKFKDLDTTVINDAKRIISQMNTGNECDYKDSFNKGRYYGSFGAFGYYNNKRI